MGFSSKAMSLVALALVPAVLCQTDPGNAMTDYKIPEEDSTPKPKISLGCFKETVRGKALADFKSTTSKTMKVKECETYCAQFPSTMFGLGRGDTCFCGNVLGAGTIGAPTTECNTACLGDGSAFCGGTLRVSIYGPEELNTQPEVPSTAAHKGCYKEPGTGRALSDFPSLTDAKMTVQMCQDHCSGYQSTYFGVENARECYCGNSVSSASPVANTVCKTPCVGDKGSFCGAYRYFNLYELDFSRFASIGQWGPLIKFPLVPVAIALLPESGNLLAWSAGWANRWTFGGNGKTMTAIYDSKSGQVSAITAENTKHDMFCPGISMDAEGKIIVNGGSTAAKTSIFDSKTNTWTGSGDMAIPRAYQSSVLTSDGKVFTVGGDFRGVGKKNGELFNPANGTWNKLPGCPVDPMLMATGRGSFRADSHAWLFGWKDGYVLQAGPSKAMNWYGTRGAGSQKPAGLRGNDADSMCGVFVMYDAIAGKILTMGGQPTYDGSKSTANAHILTLGEGGGAVDVQRIGDANYNRGFANGVVLPDGKVFIVGGQSQTLLFSDSSPQLFPEMWDPKTQRFSKLRAHVIPRNYHSTAILMPDATVFSGGGGLCNGCTANHFDGQMYSPPYLFESDGKTPATRPFISSSNTEVKLGGSLTITMASAGSYTFSLIRMGTSTHAVNTDQRRIPLTATGSGSEYSASVPTDAGVALPGYWMLFAMNESVVPSVARTVKVVI